MQIFNLGVGEVVFILLIAVVVLGPIRIMAFSRRAGLWLRALVNNPLWQEVVTTSYALRNLPNQLVEDTGLKSELDAINAEIVEIDRSVECDLQNLKEDVSLSPSITKPERAEKNV